MKFLSSSKMHSYQNCLCVAFYEFTVRTYSRSFTSVLSLAQVNGEEVGNHAESQPVALSPEFNVTKIRVAIVDSTGARPSTYQIDLVKEGISPPPHPPSPPRPPPPPNKELINKQSYKKAVQERNERASAARQGKKMAKRTSST